jgi:hypothetical protein
MIFTNTRAQNSYNGLFIQQSKNTTQMSRLPFSLAKPRSVHVPIPTQEIIIQHPEEIKAPVKKMKWGEPIWNLFHLLAEKVREESFLTIREELLNLIYTVCANLPCPDCANHAVSYMNGINYKTIQTKAQLQDMLFTFHNSVNIRKGFYLFPKEKLSERYSNMKTISVLHIFMFHFKDKHKSIRMIANDFHRSKIAENLKQWFNLNIRYFDM